jgi:hypothetical protein
MRRLIDMSEIKVGDKIRLSRKFTWANSMERNWARKSFEGFTVKEIIVGKIRTYAVFDISDVTEGRYDITMLEKI